MKVCKHLLTFAMLIPGVVSAHPGHDHAGFSAHALSGTEPHLILLGFALLAAVAIWLVKSR